MADDEELVMADDEEEEGDPLDWALSMADMCMNLFAFFILLFSMSDIDAKKFDQTFQSMSQALTGKGKEMSTSQITSQEANVLVSQAMMRKRMIEAQRQVFQEVKLLQTQKGVEGLVSANFEDGVITLKLPGDVLFPQGEAELTPEGVNAVKALRDFFIQHPDQKINIRGFTDDLPIPRGSRLKDNWELSALRAVNVLRLLVSMGVKPNRVTATGLADLEPLLPNTSPENRAKNRRVEFVLEKIVTNM